MMATVLPFRPRLEQLTPRSPVQVFWDFTVVHPMLGTFVVAWQRVGMTGWN